MRHLRIAGLTLLALAVPTFALGGEEGPPAPAALSVSASLKGCGLASAQVTCQIDASWNGLEGAEYYTVSVVRPDGVVLDLGQSSGTSRSIFVPYVGAGSYSVQVAAWGTPPGAEEPEVLDRDRSFSTDGGTARAHAPAARAGRSGAGADGRDAAQGAAEGSDPAVAASAPLDPTVGEEPGADRDECEEPEPPVDEAVGGEPAPEATAAVEQYDPADADSDDGCALSPGP